MDDIAFPPPSPGKAPSKIESTLSTTSSTTVLNNVAAQLGYQSNPINIDVHTAQSVVATALREPKRRRHHGIEYIEVLVKGEGKKARTSWYWQHGTEFEKQKKDSNDKYPRYWVCDLCTSSFTHYTDTGSQKINKHLKNEHKLTVMNPSSSRVSIHEQLQQHTPQAITDTGLSKIDEQRILEKKFYTAFVAFMVCCQQAFRLVENPWFITFLATLSNLLYLLPKSHGNVREWIVESYASNKVKIKKALHTARSRIHLSFDLWTSGNYYNFCAVVAHFVTQNHTVKTALIGFREVMGVHSGENIAESVRTVCEEYDIVDKLGCFVLDNAKNNDTCIRTLHRSWGWKDSDVPRRRLRCMGHIINLVAHAFVLGEKQTEFEEVLHAERNDLELEGRVKLWNICGPIGKLHYIVVYILRTPQRRTAFKAGGDDCDPTTFVPKRDNSTRWNSIFEMISRALDLRQAIDFYVFQNLKTTDEYEKLRRAGRKEGFLEEMKLTTDDWYILGELKEALKIFAKATKSLEGKAEDFEFGAMAECIPIIERMQSELIRLQERFPETNTFPHTTLDSLELDEEAPVPSSNPATAFMTNCTNNAFLKLQKYYALTDASVWYTVGLILNPAVKWGYFEFQWVDKPDWLVEAKKKVRSLWTQEYKPVTTTVPQKRKITLPERGNQPTTSVRSEGNFRDSSIFEFRTVQSSTHVPRDEYQEYLAEALETFDEDHLTVSALTYWTSNAQRWPNLSRMAFDALSIPAMSAECERCFSSAKNTITDLRNRLGPDSIETCECQRHWFLNMLL
jgi:hAT family C-terminal dimerisation region